LKYRQKLFPARENNQKVLKIMSLMLLMLQQRISIIWGRCTSRFPQ